MRNFFAFFHQSNEIPLFNPFLSRFAQKYLIFSNQASYVGSFIEKIQNNFLIFLGVL